MKIVNEVEACELDPWEGQKRILRYSGGSSCQKQLGLKARGVGLEFLTWRVPEVLLSWGWGLELGEEAWGRGPGLPIAGVSRQGGTWNLVLHVLGKLPVQFSCCHKKELLRRLESREERAGQFFLLPQTRSLPPLPSLPQRWVQVAKQEEMKGWL